MKASKIEGIDEKELEVVKKLGEGSFGEVFKASYKGGKKAIEQMKNDQTSIIELAVLLRGAFKKKNVIKSGKSPQFS